jgi:hypothetical protein
MQASDTPLDAARIAHLMRAYLAADYRWELSGDWHHLRIGHTESDVEALYPDHLQFGLLSAWDPHSVKRPELVNRTADRALQQALQAAGWPHRAAFSSAANRSWREPSWLVVGIGAAELDALARRFGQLGTLFWERGQPVRLRMDATPPQGLGHEPFVDWLNG